MKRVHCPTNVVFAYQGDGDLAAIGTAETVHAATRGENITVIFVNNAIYGMTGGQMAPTSAAEPGHPDHPLRPRRPQRRLPGARLRDALDPRRRGLRRSASRWTSSPAHRPGQEGHQEGLREPDATAWATPSSRSLSTCPTNWGKTPQEAFDWLRENMLPYYPLGVYKDVKADGFASIEEAARERAKDCPSPTRLPKGATSMATIKIVLAGFGGQGVLFAGKLIANTALVEDREVSWLPSYGPEMRGGTANCSVTLSDEPIGSPLVVEPDALVAMNQPSLDKFVDAVEPGGRHRGRQHHGPPRAGRIRPARRHPRLRGARHGLGRGARAQGPGQHHPCGQALGRDQVLQPRGP